MVMFTGYFEVSVNFNVENRRKNFLILISILYPIYSILIRSQNVLCFLRELLMSFLIKVKDCPVQCLLSICKPCFLSLPVHGSAT